MRTGRGEASGSITRPEAAVSIQNNRGPCGTIQEEILHRHRLELENINEPYKCNGCCEDGNGERYQCPKCDNNPRGIDGYCPPQYHSFCGKPENNLNHTAFPGRCFSLRQVRRSECVNQPNLYCFACSKDIEGFHYYSRSTGGNLYLHPWCMHLDKQRQLNDINVRLEKTTRNDCIHCGLRQLERNCTNSRGQNVTQTMDTWSYETRDGSLSIHICCMKEMLTMFWQSRITEEYLTRKFNKGPGDSRRNKRLRKFVLALVRLVSRTIFGLVVSGAI